MSYVYRLITLTSWLMGIVIAKGFWATTAAIIFFPYAWYLTIEKIMQLNGWL